ncbi:unnamed protein product [Paramecium sonneborni]|uniref:Uncharacterized protein n=1 Tax=Paramecium sonneborni TaxID=65129 RepID=A0A8S1RPW7_9CILI|nr:unnamed protein product [Paramecium sonneborni]
MRSNMQLFISLLYQDRQTVDFICQNIWRDSLIIMNPNYQILQQFGIRSLEMVHKSDDFYQTNTNQKKYKMPQVRDKKIMHLDFQENC